MASVLEPADEPVLSVRELHTTIDTENGTVHAVDGVSFDLYPKEVLAIVGESGCGKSVTALSILGLLPKRAGRVESGEVLFGGSDLTKLAPRALNRVRGAQIAMIFQDALTGLNPVYRVGDQIAEMIRAHRQVSKREARDRAIELLELVGIPNPAARARNYVHEFSGGMRQRAMIAMAIALEPAVLIADEPTTALDVTVQAQVLDLLLRLREHMGMAILLITHDLGVVAGTADRVMVMYAGRKIEEQRVLQLFASPVHPYTWGLLASMPRADEIAARLRPIRGAPPSLIAPPVGCRFAPRCAYAQGVCRVDDPELRPVGQGALAACHFADRPGWSPTLTPEEFARSHEDGVR
jgi:oligopeptide/dipeptide ABC transporter ATP-binding protein